MARARWRALLTAGTVVSSSSATSATLPAQYVGEDQRGPLAGGQVLEGGDEGQADRLPVLGHLGRVGVLGNDRASGIGVTQVASGSIGPRKDSPEGESGPISMGRARRCTLRSMSMHTLVAIRYSHERRTGPTLEAVGVAPGPHHGLLHGVLGLEPRAEHAVAVAGQLPAERLQVRRGRWCLTDCHDWHITDRDGLLVRSGRPFRCRMGRPSGTGSGATARAVVPGQWDPSPPRRLGGDEAWPRNGPCGRMPPPASLQLPDSGRRPPSRVSRGWRWPR